jgi:uncharacterized protein (UPF0332 family)
MSFDWRDYKKVADELLRSAKPPLEEAYLRSTISRSYYSAYHCATLKFLGSGWSPPSGKGGHEYTILQIQTSHSVCAQLLFGLKAKRKKADYYHNYPGDLLAEAKNALLHADRILKFC